MGRGRHKWRGRPRTSFGDPKTRRSCARGSPGSGAREASPGVETQAQYRGRSGMGGSGRAGGAAAGAGEAGGGEWQSQHRALPFVPKSPSRLDTPPAVGRPAPTRTNACTESPLRSSRRWPELGSDLGIRPVRPLTGAARFCSPRTWLGGVPDGVCSATDDLRPRGLCLTRGSCLWSPCAHPSWCAWRSWGTRDFFCLFF